jgi:hypothetical protein
MLCGLFSQDFHVASRTERDHAKLSLAKRLNHAQSIAPD